jgi:1-acyl-sn-glycerol-3-phosphate acyltransferase
MGRLAKMKKQVYKDPRHADYFQRFHQRARETGPDWVYTLVRLIMAPICFVLFRLQVTGKDNVPLKGRVILAPNHFSFADHFLVAAPLGEHKVQFMAKSNMFKRPWQWIYTHGGVFPVRRGQRDLEAIKTAQIVIEERDNPLCIYCEGGRSRSGQISERAKPGIGRLALETGATVVPVAIRGSEKARNWKRLEIPKITVRYGKPIQFAQIKEPTKTEIQAAADQVLEAIREIYL